MAINQLGKFFSLSRDASVAEDANAYAHVGSDAEKALEGAFE